MDIGENEAESREDIICPNCLEKGHCEKYPAFTKNYDDERRKIINGTKCTNPKKCDGKRVPPEQVEKQLAPKKYGIGPLQASVPDLPRKPMMIGVSIVAFVVLFILIPSFIGSLIGGGEASDRPNPDEVMSNNDPVEEGDEWAIYGEDGEFFVTNGTSYFDGSGPTGSVEWFTSLEEAQDSLDEVESDDALTEYYDEWVLKQTDSGYVLWNGNQYLTPDGLSTEPYTYDDYETARDRLESWFESQGRDFDSASTDGENVEYDDGEHIIYETENGYAVWDGTQYLTPDGWSTEPYYYDTYDDAESALNRWQDGGDSESSSGSDGDNTTVVGDDSSGDGVNFGEDGTESADTSDSDPDTVNYNPQYGQVLDENEEPLEGVTIVVLGVSGNADSRHEATSDSNGEYAFDEHPTPGVYEIYATGQGRSTSPVEIEVHDDYQIEMSKMTDEVYGVADPEKEGDYLVNNEIFFEPSTSFDIEVTGDGKVSMNNTSQ